MVRPRAIPQDAFFRAPPPPLEPGPLTAAARSPMRLAWALLALGVAGILVQRSFLRQLVVGAPLFEEMAKLGLALLAASIFGVRGAPGRLAFAWLVGAAFGVFEHAVTYPSERTGAFVLRVAFHTGSTGLSMALLWALEGAADVRLRWAAILPSVAVHWANNFGVLLLSLGRIVLPIPFGALLAWSLVLTAIAFVATLAVLARPGGARRAVRRQTSRSLARPPLS